MLTWDKETVIPLIRKHFSYLEDKDMEFLFVDFQRDLGYFVMVFQLPYFRVRFRCEHVEFTMQIGTNQAVLDSSWVGWHDLTTIILYLTQRQFLIMEDRHYYDRDADDQLEKLSKVMHYYYDQIVELFTPDVFEKEEEQLRLAYKYLIHITMQPEMYPLMEQSKKYWEEIMK